jgi:hypothetical protein
MTEEQKRKILGAASDIEANAMQLAIQHESIFRAIAAGLRVIVENEENYGLDSNQYTDQPEGPNTEN